MIDWQKEIMGDSDLSKRDFLRQVYQQQGSIERTCDYLGISVFTFKRIANQLKIPIYRSKEREHKKNRSPLHDVDWNKPFSQIAKETNRTQATVSCFASIHGITDIKHRRPNGHHAESIRSLKRNKE